MAIDHNELLQPRSQKAYLWLIKCCGHWLQQTIAAKDTNRFSVTYQMHFVGKVKNSFSINYQMLWPLYTKICNTLWPWVVSIWPLKYCGFLLQQNVVSSGHTIKINRLHCWVEIYLVDFDLDLPFFVSASVTYDYFGVISWLALFKNTFFFL